jgi:hypothetical protein
MQIGGKDIEFFCVNMALKKKTLKICTFEKTPFHASLFGNGLNKLWFGVI